MPDQITVMRPNAAAALGEWHRAQLAACAAETQCAGGWQSETARSLRATARELRQVAWTLMRVELQRAAALSVGDVPIGKLPCTPSANDMFERSTGWTVRPVAAHRPVLSRMPAR